MKKSGQFHTPAALLMGKEPPAVPTECKMVWMLWRRERYFEVDEADIFPKHNRS
jgi:hypothetical protein